ncbi:MarR family winged helix-turn-helix transcriptional regulator [Streptomyces griseorubiginosus]|uniref:MarR family winged helix-turn-helix transcriptional regulator n=1 Tax=Streptomyces griseorubiginosus TaxID=67304 RepID=UPI001AD6D501|nr:MarR family transcriptional regulator [Streptomyces griseorubiginosus]MBO4259548.1 MarR family transcriptional regulator [Streptomyces griseorubiginosus]
MTSTPPDDNVADLNFQSFAAYAHRRTSELAGDVDLEAALLVLTLHRAASTVVYDLESSVHRPAGWSWSGFRLLYVLWVAGPLEARHAARLSGMSRQNTSTLSNTLERQGLLTRSPAPDDGRLITYALTPEGTQRVHEAYRAHNEREGMWAQVLTPGERAGVISALGKLLAAADDLDVRRRD